MNATFIAYIIILLSSTFVFLPDSRKNSKQLAQELYTIKVKSDEILISYNVVSLFTKTLVDVI